MRLQNRTDDEEQRAHAEAGDEQRELAPQPLNAEEHEDGSRDDFDDAVDAAGEQAVLRASVADGGEDLRGVVAG